jgi:hypothetical protein
VIVGGARFAARLRGSFAHYTIVDSKPFMAALHRQRAVERDGLANWEPHSTRTPREVGALLKHNIELYSQILVTPTVRQTSMFEVFERAIFAREAARASSQTTFPIDGRRIVRLPVLVETSTRRRAENEEKA